VTTRNGWRPSGGAPALHSQLIQGVNEMQTANITTLATEPTRDADRTTVVGRVVSKDADSWTVTTEDGAHTRANAAASCLLQPRPADRVLLFRTEQQSWILAILERSESQAENVIETDGPLTVGSRTGSLSLAAGTRIAMTGRSGIEMKSPSVGVRTGLLNLVARRADWLAGQVEGKFDSLQLVGNLVQSVVDLVRQKTRSSYREVESFDQLRSGQIDYRADHTMSLKGRNIVEKADDLARIDGRQIHIG